MRRALPLPQHCYKESAHCNKEGRHRPNCYPHMPIGMVWTYRLLFVFLFVCTVTDFSGQEKASGVKFWTAVQGRPRQRISHFGELCSPEAQNRTIRRAAGYALGMCG